MFESFVSTSETGIETKRFKVTFTNDVNESMTEEYDEYTPHELARLFAFIIATKREEGKEMLKPFKMARVSPRSFWNVVRLFHTVEDGLRQIFPKLDWFDSSSECCLTS